MSTNEALERGLRATLADTAPRREPEALFEEVLALTSTVRQRPRLLAGRTMFEVPAVERRTERRWGLILVVGLMVLGLLVALAIAAGSRPTRPLGDAMLAVADGKGLSLGDGNGTEVRNLISEGPAFDPRWSPDAGYIGVLVGNGRLHTLVIVRPDGTVVGRTASVKEFRWLGEFVLVVRDGGQIDVLRPDLVSEHGELPIDPLIGSVARMADALAVRHDHASGAINAWGGSPQNRGLITFITFRPGHGSGGSGIVTVGTDVRDMEWSSAEDRLAFLDTTCDPSAPEAGCDGTLSVVDAGGTDLRPLVARISATSELMWDASGNRILAAQVVGAGSQPGPATTGIVLVETNPVRVVQLTRGLATDVDPRWADGEHLVLFLRGRHVDGSVARDAWSIRTDGSDPTLLAVDVNGVDWRPGP